jgi:hypothetical protein
MAAESRSYETQRSSFGGHPVRSVGGLAETIVRTLEGFGLMDVEQVIASASLPAVKPFLAQALGGSEEDLDRLVGELEGVLSPEAVAAIQGPVLARYALGGLVGPTPETDAKIRAAALQAPASLTAAGAPMIVNFTKLMPPVRDQSARGTCVAFAFTAVHEFFNKLSGDPQDFSEEFLYYEAKLIDPDPGKLLVPIQLTCGTYMNVVADVLNTLGQCREVVWSYNPLLLSSPSPFPCNNNGTEPVNARADAARYRLRTFQISIGDPASGIRLNIDPIKTALAAQSLVAVLFRVFNSWYQSKATEQTGFINMPIGGELPLSDNNHAVCLVGYQDDPNVPGGASSSCAIVGVRGGPGNALMVRGTAPSLTPMSVSRPTRHIPRSHYKYPLLSRGSRAALRSQSNPKDAMI